MGCWCCRRERCLREDRAPARSGRTERFLRRPITLNNETKLLVKRDDITVKVEVSTVMRGTVHPVEMRQLSAAASDILQADLELPVTSIEDTYGGKLAAAMDRQHPREVFDEQDITLEYSGAFAGMTAELVPLENLLETRTRKMRELQTGLDAEERAFLVSLVAAEPDWTLLDVPYASQLPGVKWKLLNLEKLRRENAVTFAEQRERLIQMFAATPHQLGSVDETRRVT